MIGETLRHTLTITNPQGLHMRPLAALVEAASKYQSSVMVLKADMPPVNGKSLVNLLGLAAEQGTQIILEVCGPDAADALKAVIDAIERTRED